MKKIIIMLLVLAGCSRVVTKPQVVIHTADSTSVLIPVIDPLKPQGGK